MKKFLLGVAAVFLITACSSDDSSPSNSFDSHIMIDGVLYTPGNNSGPQNYVITTLSENINNGEAKVRTFHLLNNATDLGSMKSMQISIIYPTAQSSVTGTYSFPSSDAAGENNFAQGVYMEGTTGYAFEAGTVTITDLGSGKFKLEFNEVTATNLQTDATVTITGYGQGKFYFQES